MYSYFELGNLVEFNDLEWNEYAQSYVNKWRYGIVIKAETTEATTAKNIKKVKNITYTHYDVLLTNGEILSFYDNSSTHKKVKKIA